jgi:hypothetical protein
VVRDVYMVSADAIIQTIGSVVGSTLGAFLGGYFAVKVMKKQIDFQIKKEQEERNEKFEKTYWLLAMSFEALGKKIVETYELLNNPAIGEKPNFAFLIGQLSAVLDESIKTINRVNDEFLPKDIYPLYLLGRTALSGAEFIIKGWDYEFRNKKGEFSFGKEELEGLYQFGKELTQIFNDINDFKLKQFNLKQSA